MAFSTAAPIPVPANALFFNGLRYDRYNRNTVDIYTPESATPTPLVIHIHGGGFTSGDRTDYALANPGDVMQFLTDGFAFASINYRFVDTVFERTGAERFFQDAKLAIDWLKSKAARFNFDTDKILLSGGSAGAGCAQYIAYDPDNDIKGLVLSVPQATYDFVRWNEVFADFSLDIYDWMDTYGGTLGLLNFYGIQEVNQMNFPEIQELRFRLDTLAKMTAQAPEMWIQNDNHPADFPTTLNNLNHHPFHSRMIKDRATFFGIPCQVEAPLIGEQTTETKLEFINRILG